MTKLSHKLFIAIFLLSLLILVSMVFLSKWALQTGFVKYLNETENLLLTSLKDDLEEIYQTEQSWDPIVNDRAAWWELLRKHLPRDAEITISKTGQQTNSKKSESPSFHGGIWRGIRLLNADRAVLIGRVKAGANATELVLQVDGATIGFLSLNPTTEIHDELGLSFTRQLLQTIQYSAVGVLVISILLTVWLAKGFVNPIKALVVGTHALTAGDFKKRLPVNAKDELGQLAKDFNNLAVTLESNENSKRQWIADISHELRTPLTILRGEIEAITDGVHQMSPKILDSLHAEILHLGTLVNDLYQLSLSDIGALSYKKVNTKVCQVLDEALEIYQDEFAKNNISLNFNPGSNAGLCILADPGRLHQLFSNVISNSLRYTDVGGQLNIDVVDRSESVQLDFQDSAPGVGEEDLPRLFERLYRVENSRNRKSGGAGLGLSICKNIVDAHQGRIEATRSSLGGLHIHIVLPKNSTA